MKKTVILLLPFALVLGCSSGGRTPDSPPDSTAPPESTQQKGSTPDSSIGLAAGTVFEQPPQHAVPFNTVEPGDSELRDRPNSDFPPVIPHSIEGLALITQNENACIECHDPTAAADVGAIAIPQSHTIDLRRDPETSGEQVTGARWVCTSCHVEQTNVEPLLANYTR